MRTAISASLLAILCSFVVSCRIDAPIREMVKARSSINRAYDVKADKYDPENFNQALQQLYNCHTTLKANDIPGAKKAAIESYNFATASILKALPLLAADTLAEATKLFQDAENLNAELFAPEQLARAETAIKEADAFKAGQKYWDSCLKSREAITAAGEAKTLCQARIPAIQETIAGLKNQVALLKTKDVQRSFDDDLRSADENLQKASESVTAGTLKDASKNITEADGIIKKISLQINKTSAQDRIRSLRSEAAQLSKQRGTEFANDDIDVVMSTLNEAETLIEQEKTDEALLKINDAENSLKIARQKTKKGIALSALDSVDRLVQASRKKDTNGALRIQFDQAGTLVTEGRQFYDQESYDSALAKATEADSLLRSLGIREERDRMGREGIEPSTIDTAGMKTYIVRYNRKNRDCLWKIALHVYNNPRLWPLIYVANRDKIKDPDLIFPGQKFTIPPLQEKQPLQFKDEVDQGKQNKKLEKETSEETDKKETPPAE